MKTKHSLLAAGLLASVLAASPAYAGNSSVEATLQSYGDVSIFYQALLNTGVINELQEGQHYTIFAPTNAAFAQVQRRNYPCFYAVQCRAQVAALLREHIVVDNHDYKDLVSYGYGIKTLSGDRVHVEEPYTGDYTVNGEKIMSKSEVGGNVIYRVDGLIATPEQMAQFQAVPVVIPASTVTEKTVTRTYNAPVVIPPQPAYPAGGMVVAPNVPADGAETTTVIHSYTTQPQ